MNRHLPPGLPRRIRLCALFLFALYAWTADLPASAQSDGQGKNRAQSVLHIQAQVAPVAYPPAQGSSESSAERSISFRVPRQQPEMAVMEEVHAFPQGGQGAILKTTTVILR